MAIPHTLIEPASPTLTSNGDSTPRLKPVGSPAFGANKGAMAASFLQYCAMCEKQIMTPCNSILYCSEACRKKDDAKPISASMLPASYLSASAPTSPSPTSPVQSPRSTYITTPVVRIPAELHDHKPDLDPTEWKPKLIHRNHSEAYLYLSKFHTNTNASGGDYVRVHRPGYGHKHTISMTTTPSLGNSPTTAASSFDSVYSFNTRPLNQRTNPMYALSSGAKSAELVTPHIPPPAVSVNASAPAHGKITWEKKIVTKDPASVNEGLGALLQCTE